MSLVYVIYNGNACMKSVHKIIICIYLFEIKIIHGRNKTKIFLQTIAYMDFFFIFCICTAN